MTPSPLASLRRAGVEVRTDGESLLFSKPLTVAQRDLVRGLGRQLWCECLCAELLGRLGVRARAMAPPDQINAPWLDLASRRPTQRRT